MPNLYTNKEWEFLYKIQPYIGCYRKSLYTGVYMVAKPDMFFGWGDERTTRPEIFKKDTVEISNGIFFNITEFIYDYTKDWTIEQQHSAYSKAYIENKINESDIEHAKNIIDEYSEYIDYKFWKRKLSYLKSNIVKRDEIKESILQQMKNS